MRYANMASLFLVGLSAFAADDASSKPATPTKESAAHAPWSFDPFWLFRLERNESGATQLNGREIWYRNRGPARHRMHVFVDKAEGEIGKILVRVPSFEREMETRGAKRTLRFDPTLYDEREDGRRVFLLSAAADPANLDTLRTIVKHPWYAMRWSTGAWTDLTTTARGHAWPLADGLTLDRELALLMPNIPGDQRVTDSTHQQTVVLPYPAPLTPAPAATVTYRIVEIGTEEGHRVAAVDFSASLNQVHASGIEWGGIRLSNVRMTATLSGRLNMVLEPRRLYRARVKLETRLKRVGDGERFESRWKLDSDWKGKP